jgi:hypothetical protein
MLEQGQENATARADARLQSTQEFTTGGGVSVSVATLILILLVPFGVGFVFNRWEAERRARRFG